MDFPQGKVWHRQMRNYPSLSGLTSVPRTCECAIRSMSQSLALDPAEQFVHFTRTLRFVFTSAAKVLPKGATLALISPDVAIDSLVAHQLDALEFCRTNDLLGTELFLYQLFDRLELVRPKALVTSRSTAPTAGLLAGRTGAIIAIILQTLRTTSRSIVLRCLLRT